MSNGCIRAVLAQAGEEAARSLLEFFQRVNINKRTCYLIEAIAGWNRKSVLAEIEQWNVKGKRKSHWDEQEHKYIQQRSPLAIKAYGLLPLERGEEEAQERYRMLQTIIKRIAEYDNTIRVAVQTAMHNIAQVAGHPAVIFKDENSPLSETEQQTMIAWVRFLRDIELVTLLRLANTIQQKRCICEGLYGAQALPLFEQIMLGTPSIDDRLPAIRLALEEAGEKAAHAMLEAFQHFAGTDSSSYLIEAIKGWNRAAIIKSLKHDKQLAIEGYGLLPLERGEEEVLERYLTLQTIAKRAQKFGPQRSVSHRECVQSAFQHLALLAGYPDVTLLEWDMEARTAQDAAQVGRTWTINDYTLRLDLEGLDVSLAVERNGRQLKSVPGAIRNHATYQEAKEAVKILREQISRLRRNLLERLIITGESLDVAILKKLSTLPTARALLSRLLMSIGNDTIGLFDAEAFVLKGLHGEQYAITESVTIVHPYTLYINGTLAEWQRAIVHQRIVQPVKQVFRELYVLTPAEQRTRTYSNRFAGRAIEGVVAKKLFINRHWSMERLEFSALVTPYKVLPGMRVVFEVPDAVAYVLTGPLTTGRIYFEPYPLPEDDRRSEEERFIPLEEIPPLIFSEVMRDADLIVSVAARQQNTYELLSAEVYEKRRELLQALLADLNLSGVTVEGHFAYVQGKLARYRVHLSSASIHIEPGSYLCIVPANWGQSHPNLFLPFADEDDQKISEVISKIFLLLADDQIKDESILRQIRVSTS